MLDKKYNHKEVEKDKYNNWVNKGYFKGDKDKSKEPFCIVIPPPNVTGKLHLGHAWDTTLQDILIRYKRMNGYDALWVPGMDHAGIATQAKVDKRLREMGINPRGITRDEWLEHAWSWKDEYATTIHEQWAKLGLSLDYTKERFTLDEGLSKAVRYVFVKLYEKGLIYRGERIINWDPVQMTALSNEEVIYKEDKGAFYHIKYYITGTDEYLDVATTRPETLFGDTAVAVNPSDDRYKHLIGKTVILPIVNKEIPIVGDIHADPDFGSGIVKITPAHDPNDYEVGLRHNLPRVVVMNLDATMNKNAPGYEGMTREECREKLVEDLKKQDLLIGIEEMTHNVGHSERSDAVVEPTLSKQWFVKMRPLADRVLENQKNKDTKVNFVPERYEKTMNHWMEITYDWCISRQLWWGHRIPAWYKDDEVYVGMEAPEGDGWVQDEDVLDTWFSSALWPFSTLGWPEETELFKRYYPNNVLVTGYDIIPFWVNRMTFQGLEFTGKRPFKDCLIHGLIRDKEGRKMSKSLGNGVDPMDVIDKYGADSLRFFLTTNTAPGTDLRYDEEKVKSTWNFINKLWNASRYVLMNLEDMKTAGYDYQNLSKADKWILTLKNNLIKDVIKNMDSYDFHNVGNMLYKFIWEDFCDNYIELSKANMNDTTKAVLLDVLTTILKLLHPFMPYVTEEIYQMLPFKDSESIVISTYPKYDSETVFDKEAEEISKVIVDLREIRNLKATNNIKKDDLVIFSTNSDLEYIYKSQLKITDDIIIKEPLEDYQSINYKSSLIDITYFFKNEVNKEELETDIKKLKDSIERRKKLLSNENYVNKAPKNIVDLDREKLKEEEAKLKLLEEQL
ncbi:MAG TPA: valine--tRNA ligase [Candidatus Onthousia excrementipullorum]|uniref:Valine--tRNA ligase n=1 Tax=Candidatus Onthousia excrementipullorum TaxID=2840884 RepID=A0A9D1DV59_9FIRM|nr:valine--tRNA ligase [Candidatus Onthousia excrementipullorum]